MGQAHPSSNPPVIVPYRLVRLSAVALFFRQFAYGISRHISFQSIQPQEISLPAGREAQAQAQANRIEPRGSSRSQSQVDARNQKFFLNFPARRQRRRCRFAARRGNLFGHVIVTRSTRPLLSAAESLCPPPFSCITLLTWIFWPVVACTNIKAVPQLQN